MSEKIEHNKILVLFSGGSDSTLAAVIAAKNSNIIYLLTFKRYGLFASQNSNYNILRLEKKFSDKEFIHLFSNFNYEYKKISTHNRIKDIFKYGLITLSICGQCKLAMHWKTILLCKELNCNVVYDGAVKASEIFPDQNNTIFINEIKNLYKEHNILYQNPVYNIDTQKYLFNEQIIATDKLKGTYKDVQPMCSQQLLFSKFVNCYLYKYPFTEYEEKLKAYYYEKINYLRNKI